MSSIVNENKLKSWITSRQAIPFKTSYALSNFIDLTICEIADDFSQNPVIYFILSNQNEQQDIIYFDNCCGKKLNWFKKIHNLDIANDKITKALFNALIWLSDFTKILTNSGQQSIKCKIDLSHIIKTNKIDIFIGKNDEFTKKTSFKNGTLYLIKNLKKRISFQKWCETGKEIAEIYQRYLNKIKINWIYLEHDKIIDATNGKLISNIAEANALKYFNQEKVGNENKTVSINTIIDSKTKKFKINGLVWLRDEAKKTKISKILCFTNDKLINTMQIIDENNNFDCELDIDGLEISEEENNYDWTNDEINFVKKEIINALERNKVNKCDNTTTDLVNEFNNFAQNITDSLKSTKFILNVKNDENPKDIIDKVTYEIVNEYGGAINIRIIQDNQLNSQNNCWIQKQKEDNTITVIVNFEHPFFKPFLRLKSFYQFIIKFIICYVLAEEKAINEGSNVEELKLLIDSYLRRSIK